MADETMHTCDGAGWLVRADTPMLADPTDWCWPGREPVPYGCNHLKCFICGATVKQRAGWAVRTSALGEGTEWRDKCVALYENEDWGAFDYAYEAPRWRLYHCRCSVLNNDANRPIVDPRADDRYGKPPAGPYRCAGHPLPVLPFRYHGITADYGADLEPVVRRVLAGDVPPSAVAEDLTPTNLVVNLRRRLEDTPGADRVDEAVIRCMDDPDPRVIMGAIAYVWNVPTESLALALAAAADRHLARWSETADPRPVRGPSLAARALLTIGELTPRLLPPERALPPLREAGGRSGLSAAALPALIRVDEAWVHAHLDEVLRASVGNERDVLLQLFQASFPIGDVVRRMLDAGSAPAAVRDAVDQYVWGDWLADALAVLDAHGG